MKIKTAVYISSNVKIEDCPPDDRAEYAFIGRSNVGKSSLINMLCGVNGLARISSTPGKTQIINHYLVNDDWYLVDLPGYGYAKVSKVKRAQFNQMISRFILGRKNLMCVFVLVDSRIEPQRLDLEFMESLATNGIAFAICFTKCDKLSVIKLPKAIAAYKKIMLEEWEEFPMYFLTSAEKKKGKKEVLDFIEETNKIYVQLNS
ncbi:ribosome biogenesis GTP-binding protein YihA/YsxC [soil metagenome]